MTDNTEQKQSTQPKTTKTKNAASRPQVTVYTIHGKASKRYLPMPDVLLAPIRQDIVQFVHTNMNKNNRQPYAVKCQFGPKGIVAGHQVAARSWGTGRAVSRVPRVKGGGTHRAGQGAYANMCRGGRMFAPTKVYRRWQRRINTNQKRYAVVSGLSASAVPSLVMARGHRIQTIPEIPIVLENDFELLTKTSHVITTLRHLRLNNELNRCNKRYLRAGRGKSRNRRWKHRLGPLIIYKNDRGIVSAARNIRGVDFCRVDQINLLKLCPGGHLGRLVIWTESAFKHLNRLYGTQRNNSQLKRNYHIPRPIMLNSDLNRIINSQEIQSNLRPKKRKTTFLKKRNPLKHPELYAELNPYFEKQLPELRKNFKDNTRPSTISLLQPLRKKQRISIDISPEQRKQMQKYWDMVIGPSLFKTRQQINLERKAVQVKLQKLADEKAGKDLQRLFEEQDRQKEQNKNKNDDDEDSDE